MPGNLWQKFANLRLLLLFSWMHPGKKLLFMGAEFGQWSEWYCKQSLDFHLLQENPLHTQLLFFVEQLNLFYKKNPSLWQLDCSYEGFQWLDLEDRQNSIVSFVRYGKDRADHLVCLFNFTPQTLSSYPLGLPTAASYAQVFCSDDQAYGGSQAVEPVCYQAVAEPFAQAPCHAIITVPPLAGLILKPVS
jgi:1,4-alpha-glucan branching enzyme